MNASLNINGFTVDACFDDEAVQSIFLPLLRDLSRRQQRLNRRMTVLLAAPPGAGKSTLAAFLEQLSRTEPGLVPVQALGMDGFHFHQDFINAHTVYRGGREIPMRLVKGAPDTFDVPKLRRTLEDMKTKDVLWPYYDRNLHDVVEDAVPVRAPILLIEGNWLLYDHPAWQSLPADMRIFIDAQPHLLKDRLISRKIRGGFSREEAQAHYDRSDGPNVILCRENHVPADLCLVMTGEGRYRTEEPSMRYKAVLFDVDGTLTDSEGALVSSLILAMQETGIPDPGTDLHALAMRNPKKRVLETLNAADVEASLECWNRHLRVLQTGAKLFPGADGTMRKLHELGVSLGVVTARSGAEVDSDASMSPLSPLFCVRACAENTAEHKPHPAPILHCLDRLGLAARDVLYVGDSPTDGAAAHAAGVDFALAQWGCLPGEHIPAEYYLVSFDDLLPIVRGENTRWLDWAKELQFIAQAGLTYSKDSFDIERFQRIREISAEILAEGSGMEITRLTDLFCSETGFQTPKLDTRAALFQEDKILLVRERDGRWSLPGGWVDVNQSVGSNAVKEVLEEAGLTCEIVKLIAVQDRNRHNRPVYAYGICKVFVLCRAVGGAFQENIETTESACFGIDELPPLAEEKNTAAQVRMCFAARRADWQPPID
ncbi:MAG: nucleoside/nucleotide kinase family protein [Clostridia bacterium]|nr:nucleoside/nucleotide kinase family protein [Clostridia bacterium]